jgi:hypothetical protein
MSIEQTLVEPSIIKISVPEDFILDVAGAQAMRLKNLELSGGRKFCVLLDTRKGYFTTTPEALKALASPEFHFNRIGTAIIVASLATRLIGNFFRVINGQASPTRIFNSEQEALKWLRGLILKSFDLD